MDKLLKSGDKAKIKKYFPKFQSILMQVAKTGVINKTFQETFQNFKKI